MRYMLYECNDNKVELTKELQYLQNYIDLQKIRFGNKAFIDFEVHGEVNQPTYRAVIAHLFYRECL
jgi:two-component system LytT family sensor kinase